MTSATADIRKHHVCLYVCMYDRMHISRYERANVSMRRIYVCIPMCVRIYLSIYVCIYVYMYSMYMCMSTPMEPMYV